EPAVWRSDPATCRGTQRLSAACGPTSALGHSHGPLRRAGDGRRRTSGRRTTSGPLQAAKAFPSSGHRRAGKWCPHDCLDDSASRLSALGPEPDRFNDSTRDPGCHLIARDANTATNPYEGNFVSSDELISHGPADPELAGHLL